MKIKKNVFKYVNQKFKYIKHQRLSIKLYYDIMSEWLIFMNFDYKFHKITYNCTSNLNVDL